MGGGRRGCSRRTGLDGGRGLLVAYLRARNADTGREQELVVELCLLVLHAQLLGYASGEVA